MHPSCACPQRRVSTQLTVLPPAGGKWTTYRLMAQDAIDRAVAEGRLPAQPCSTAHLKLIGSGA
jgi:glycerol-3-phosphate dehydrogenase